MYQTEVGFLFRFFTCPQFIYDNGKPITNAEWISTLLKSDLDVAASELWNQAVLNKGCVELSDFKEWLKLNAEINNKGECDWKK